MPSGAFQARLGVYPLNANVAEPLTRLTADFRLAPSLATRWEYRGDRTWRFVLRRGVRFHDGRPLDGASVEASLRAVVQGGYGYSFLTDSSVTVVDDSTVDITTSRTNLRLPEQLAHPNYSIFAAGSDPGVLPVGTGPFRFVEYEPDERFVVARFDDYWGESARLEGITFRFYPDPTARVLALLGGEVDLVMDLPREQVSEVERRPGYRVSRAEVGQMLNLQVNLHGSGPYALLSEPDLRRALGAAIDRRGLVERIWEGEGELVQNMTVPSVLEPFADRVDGLSHDPPAAERALEAAGWRMAANGVRRKDGRELRLVLLSNPEVDAGPAEFLQSELRGIGVRVDWLRLADAGSYASRLRAGEFHLNLALPNQNDADPLFLPALIFYSESDNVFSRWHRVGPGFDSLVAAGLAAPDPLEARRLAAEAIDLALRGAAVISLAGRYRLYAASEAVEGFRPHPSQTNQSWASVHLAGRSR